MTVLFLVLAMLKVIVVVVAAAVVAVVGVAVGVLGDSAIIKASLMTFRFALILNQQAQLEDMI